MRNGIEVKKNQPMKRPAEFFYIQNGKINYTTLSVYTYVRLRIKICFIYAYRPCISVH